MVNQTKMHNPFSAQFHLVTILGLLTLSKIAIAEDTVLEETESSLVPSRPIAPLQNVPPPDTPEADMQTRETIIKLIEERLSNAYSFTASSVHKIPHFEVLDEIHQKWHHGKPAVARQFWVHAGYTAFKVLYRVDYVYIVNDVVAEVAGKKLIMWSQLDEKPDWDDFWPFQLWASISKRSQRDDSYLSAMYTMRYKMKLTINEKEEWTISEERISDNREMVNNLRDHCMYEAQLADWGLKNDCNQKLLPE